MPRAVAIGILLVLWEAATRLLEVDPLLVPPASVVLAALGRSILALELPHYALQSFKVLLPGMLIGVVGALALTVLAEAHRYGTVLLQTLVALFNPLPAIALLPLAFLWFGLGTSSMVFVVVHAVLWTMAVSAHAGFRAVPVNLRRVGQNLGLSRVQIAVQILFPAALPQLLAGLRNSWAFAWRTVIAAELVFGVAARQGGLGWFIYRHRFEMDTDLVFAGLLALVIIGLLVESVVFRWVDHFTVVRWGMSA